MDEQVTTATAVTSPVPSSDIESGNRNQKRAEIRRLLKMLKRSQTADKRFRPRSLEAVEMYFDEQWEEEAKDAVEARGQAAVVDNRIKPTVKLIHGLMVSQPFDWLAKPVGRDDDGLAEVATAALKHVSRQNNTKTMTERIYWWALTYGVGWAMTGFHVRTRNPKDEAVQMRVVDPREVRWDPMSRELDISDARWVIWSRRVDLDDLIAEFPDKKAELANAANTKDPNLDGEEQTDRFEGVPALATPPVKDWKNLDDWNQAGKTDESETKQVVVHELWERVPTQVWLMQHRDGWTHEFDPNKREDVAMLEDPGIQRYWEATVPKVKYHVFVGNVLLHSDKSPYNHDQLPFIPCWHERDQNGDPVSIIESLKWMQREINYRRSKMLHAMVRPNVRVSPSVLDRMQIDRAGFGKLWDQGGGIIIANAGEVEPFSKNDEISQQFQLMQDSKAEIQSVSGANDDLMGYDSSSKSGVAKQVQMTQGATMQRPNESNLRLFHKLLGEQTLNLIQQAHTQEWIIRVTDNVGMDKHFFVNQRQVDEQTGQSIITNDITQARFELEIDAMPWTPTLRATASENLRKMAQGEGDPIVRTALERAAIQVDDMPEKGTILKILDEATERMMTPPPQAQEQQKATPDPISASFKDLPIEAQQSWLAKEGLIQMGPMPPDLASMVPAGTVAQQAHDLNKQELTHQQDMVKADQQHQQAMQQQALGMMQPQPEPMAVGDGT